MSNERQEMSAEQKLKSRLLEEADKILKLNAVIGKPNKQLNENDLYKIIINACDVIIIDYSEEQDLTNFTYAIYNPKTDTYVRDRSYLGSLVQYVINRQETSPNISAKRALSDIEEAIKFSKDDLTRANLPPQHIIKFENCVYDLKHNIPYQFGDKAIQHYHFINSIRYPLYSINDVDQSMLDIVKQVFHTWSEGDNEIEILIKQMIYSYVEGNGRNVQIILKSEGGDGKSTFLRMIQKLGHSSLTHHMNLDGYNDDNQLNQIQPSTNLILGDDLASNFKMGSKMLSRFKTLVDGGYINVNEKYMPNKLIKSNALKIQATNTDIKFFENNDAIKDRVILLKWPHHNFRQNPIEDFNLDELTGKHGRASRDFMIALLAYVISTTEYFNKFSVTEKMKADFEELLNDGDSIMQFINELDDIGLLDSSSHLPSNILYEYYKNWLKQTNPGSKPMKLREFTKRFGELIISKHYTEKRRMITKAIKSNEFNNILINDYINDENINHNAKTTVFVKSTLNTQNDDQLKNDFVHLNINEIKAKYDETSLKNYLYHLVHQNSEEIFFILEKIDGNDHYSIDDISTLNYQQMIQGLLNHYH